MGHQQNYRYLQKLDRVLQSYPFFQEPFKKVWISMYIFLWLCTISLEFTKLGLFNPNWHELRKQEKCSSLEPPRSKFYKTQWAWQGVKLTQLMSIFTSKKVWKFLIKIHLTKSNPKITRGVKVPCLMPIRVKSYERFSPSL